MRCSSTVRDDVANAWSVQFDQQRQQKIDFLVELQLPPRFHAKVEQYLRSPRASAIPRLTVGEKEAFYGCLQRELSQLARSVGATWRPSAKRGRPHDPVEWSPENQRALALAHFDLGADVSADRSATDADADFSTNFLPTDEAIVAAQEDLWTLASVLAILSEVNIRERKASRRAIRAIEEIRFGASMFATASVAPASSFPLRSPDIGSDLSWPTAWLPGPNPVADDIPVHLRLRIHQESLAAALVACANHSTPLTVIQLEVNPALERSSRLPREPSPWVVAEILGVMRSYRPVNEIVLRTAAR